MNLSEIQGLAQDFIRLDLDSFGQTTATVTTDQINYAVRTLARLLKPVGLVSFVFSPGVFSYSTLSSSIFSQYPVEIKTVTVSGNVLTDYARRPGLCSLDEFQILYPTWTNPGTGVVSAAAQFANTLYLYKAPTAAGSGTLVTSYIPLPISSSTAVPALPHEAHECIAYMAAVFCSLPTVTEQEALARVQSYNQSWSSMLTEVAGSFREQTYSSSYQRMLGTPPEEGKGERE